MNRLSLGMLLTAIDTFVPSALCSDRRRKAPGDLHWACIGAGISTKHLVFPPGHGTCCEHFLNCQWHTSVTFQVKTFLFSSLRPLQQLTEKGIGWNTLLIFAYSSAENLSCRFYFHLLPLPSCICHLLPPAVCWAPQCFVTSASWTSFIKCIPQQLHWNPHQKPHWHESEGLGNKALIKWSPTGLNKNICDQWCVKQRNICYCLCLPGITCTYLLQSNQTWWGQLSMCRNGKVVLHRSNMAINSLILSHWRHLVI